jgi:hypothetical protein
MATCGLTWSADPQIVSFLQRQDTADRESKELTSKQYPNSRPSNPSSAPLPGGGPKRPGLRFPRTRPTRKYMRVDTSNEVPRKWPSTNTRAILIVEPAEGA